MRAVAFVLLIAAGCGRRGPPPAAPADAGPGDAPAHVADAAEADATTTDAGIDATADARADAAAPDAAAPDAAAGTPVAGTCSYHDQPGWLSCPTGMACQCYYNYDALFVNQPGELDAVLSDATLAITGGTLPSNDTVPIATPATIALAPDGAGGKTGSAWPYTATVSAAGAIRIQIYATSDYVPASDVLYTDADCGDQGKVLDCTFAGS